MDFKSYLKQSIALRGITQNQFGSLTMGNLDSELLNKVSLFSSAKLEQVQNLDWTKLLQDVAALKSAKGEVPVESAEGEVPAEEGALPVEGEVPVEGAEDAAALEGIIKELMGMDELQTFIDADANGEVSEEEAMKFVQSIMAQDGDESTFTYDDIDKAFEQFGISLEQVTDEALAEVLKSLDEQPVEEVKKEEPKEVQSSGSNGGGGGGYNAGSSSPAQKIEKKTSSEELDELETQKASFINDADRKIDAAEQKKTDIINNSTKINDDIKQKYNAAKTDVLETQTSRREADKKLNDLNKNISGLEQTITALEAEKANLQTNTGDEKIDNENKERLKEIESSLSAKNEEKTRLQKEAQETEQKIKELDDKEKIQSNAVSTIETAMITMDPDIKSQVESANKEINNLKTQKASGVSDYDKQIEAKRKDAVNEAQKAGESKGKAASNMGSALIDIASKYMGLNEADGSYKMFTNGRTEAWCADFVTYVLNEFADSKGLKVKDGFGSPAVADLRDWAINHNVYNDITQMTSSEKQQFMLDEIKPGDIIIWKRNGLSHTGFVKCVNDDGTFETVEGNTKDAVRTNTRKIDSNQLSGFIKLSDVVA